MSVPIRCPACGWQAKAPDSAAGKRIRCAECGEALRIEGSRAPRKGVHRGAERRKPLKPLQPLEVLRPVEDIAPPPLPRPRPVRRGRPPRGEGGRSAMLFVGIAGGCGTLLLVVGVIARIAWVAVGSLDLSSPQERLEEFTPLPGPLAQLQSAPQEQNGFSIRVPLEFEFVQEATERLHDGSMVHLRQWWGPRLPEGGQLLAGVRPHYGEDEENGAEPCIGGDRLRPQFSAGERVSEHHVRGVAGRHGQHPGDAVRQAAVFGHLPGRNDRGGRDVRGIYRWGWCCSAPPGRKVMVGRCSRSSTPRPGRSSGVEDRSNTPRARGRVEMLRGGKFLQLRGAFGVLRET